MEHGVKAGLAHNDISIEDGFDSNIKSLCADPDFFQECGMGSLVILLWDFNELKFSRGIRTPNPHLDLRIVMVILVYRISRRE